ncbi:hypothetical protein ABZ897_60300 [Nonomuraea sp. NPDC046802]|uniref:hypothetical protein n=1 Tax=Nonomuraea sp. NPDC046802 TaxID=3154919 RepID=UPI0033D08733
MSRDLTNLTRHSYYGYLTQENVEAVAARLRKTFGVRPLVTVRASPNRDDGTPKVTTGCRLTEPIAILTYDDGRRKALTFSCCWSHMFDAVPRDQHHAGDVDEKDRVRIAFDGDTFTASVKAPGGLDHYVFTPEGGDQR